MRNKELKFEKRKKKKKGGMISWSPSKSNAITPYSKVGPFMK